MTIFLVGEAWGAEEDHAKAPFQGPAGKQLRSQLAEAGITDYHLSNVFNFRPPRNEIATLCTRQAREALPDYPPLLTSPYRYVKAQYENELTRLFEELVSVNPSVVIALGNTALWALTQKTGIGNYRGYDDVTIIYKQKHQWPLMATWHPAAVLRQYSLRTIAVMDLAKGADQSRQDIRRRTLVPETRDDLYHLWPYFAGSPIISCDIETAANSRITEVGFAVSESLAITIPFETLNGRSYWEDPTDEAVAWTLIREILAECPVVGHNFSYDMQYLWAKVGIPCPKFHGDTMILHHTLQPEMRKSLGFLASLYTSAPRWKHIRRENKELDA